MNIYSKEEIQRLKVVDSIADCLNAELMGAEVVLWTGSLHDLEKLKPKTYPYGWVLVAPNVEIVYSLKAEDQLKDLSKLDIIAVFAEDDVLLKKYNQWLTDH